VLISLDLCLHIQIHNILWEHNMDKFEIQSNELKLFKKNCNQCFLLFKEFLKKIAEYLEMHFWEIFNINLNII
jgi:hypothetical protein